MAYIGSSPRKPSKLYKSRPFPVVVCSHFFIFFAIKVACFLDCRAFLSTTRKNKFLSCFIQCSIFSVEYGIDTSYWMTAWSTKGLYASKQISLGMKLSCEWNCSAQGKNVIPQNQSPAFYRHDKGTVEAPGLWVISSILLAKPFSI